jgi:hypothetical protein
MEISQDQLVAAIREALSQGELDRAARLIGPAIGQQPANRVIQHLESVYRSVLLERNLDQMKNMLRRLVSVASDSAAHLGRTEIRDILSGISDTRRLEPFGWKCYSQNDEDGIIYEIFSRLDILPESGIFVEFGVENGIECNSHLLLLLGFSGVWLEGAPHHAESVRKTYAHEIAAGNLILKESQVTAENIDYLLAETVNGRSVAFLSIDIDGNDYWVWNAISVISPLVVVVEYNGKFPPPLRLVQRYSPDFVWDGSDASGCSLSALEELGRQKGYRLVGCNITGLNAFFVRADHADDRFAINQPVSALYQPPRYHLTFDAFRFVGYPARHGDFIVLPS